MTDDQFRILSARYDNIQGGQHLLLVVVELHVIFFINRLGFHKGKLSYRDFLDHFQDRRSFGIGERAPEYPKKR